MEVSRAVVAGKFFMDRQVLQTEEVPAGLARSLRRTAMCWRRILR